MRSTWLGYFFRRSTIGHGLISLPRNAIGVTEFRATGDRIPQSAHGLIIGSSGFCSHFHHSFRRFASRLRDISDHIMISAFLIILLEL